MSVVIDTEGNIDFSDSFSAPPSFITTRDGTYRNRTDRKYHSHGAVPGGDGHRYFYAYSFDSKHPELSMDSVDLAIYKSLDKVGKSAFVNQKREKFLHAFKRPTSKSIEKIAQLVLKASQRFTEHLADSRLKLTDISAIIPIGSSAKLNRYLAQELHQLLPNAVIIPDAIVKELNKNVETEIPETPGKAKAEKMVLSVLKQLRTNARAEQPFKLTGAGGIPTSLRAYFKKFYKTADEHAETMKSIMGKNIVLIDDTVYGGTTLKDAIREISKYGPKTITVFAFLDEKRAGQKT